MHRRQFFSLATGTFVVARLRGAPLPKAKADVSLIFIDYQVNPKNAKVENQRLMRLRVIGGEVGKPEEIVRLEQRFFDDMGGHHVVANRYVVSRYGSIFDLTEKKFIHEEFWGNYLGFEENRVVYRVENPNRDHGVFAFDLKERTLSKLEKPERWELSGRLSPDGKRSIAPLTFINTIEIQNRGGKKVSLGKVFTYQVIPTVNSFAPVPSVWIDNDTILTQTKNGELVLVDVKTKKRTPFATVEASIELVNPPRLDRDASGRLLYEAGKGTCILDTKNAKATPAADAWWQHGNDFESRPSEKLSEGYLFRHREKKIGSGLGYIEMLSTFPDHIAYLGYADPGNQKPARGTGEELRIWSAETNEWTRLPMFLNCFLGWITN
jgi:hypothetical protein